jgi:hypothetical protein
MVDHRVLVGITLGLVIGQLIRDITDFWVNRKK